MALVFCPECHGRVSDAATACPHCGYPRPVPAELAGTSPTPPADASSPLDVLGPEVARSVEAALRQAGFGDALTSGRVHVGPVTVGQPIVTTWTSTRTTGTDEGGRAAGPGVSAVDPRVATAGPSRVAARTDAFRIGTGYAYRSKWAIFGLPLLAMSNGYDPATGRKRVAKGWVAIGDVAVGGIAIGGAAFGGICLGGLAIGVISVGGLAVGLAVAFGGVAVGTVAVGGAALGIVAAGGGAFGLHALGPGMAR